MAPHTRSHKLRNFLQLNLSYYNDMLSSFFCLILVSGFGFGNKIFDVFDILRGELPIGLTSPMDCVHWFTRSRAKIVGG